MKLGFGFRWIKRWVRSRSSPIPIDKAELWEKRLSFAYFFCAWNLMAYMGYTYYNAEKLGITYDSDETLAEKMIRRAGMQNATIYKVNNFTIVGKRNVEPDELEEKHRERIEKSENLS